MKLTSKSKFFKKLAAIMLIAALVFSFTACKDNPADGEETTDTVYNMAAYESDIPNKKVAILVAPESQFPEDYKAAKALEAEYPNSIVVKEYDDSRVLKAGNPGVITLSEELAADKTIGAIVYARAVQYTENAIYNAKQINPDILTICIEPENEIKDISDLASLVYCVDWAKAAEDIVASAKAQGAKYFIAYSFSRHISDNSLIRGEIDYLKKACEKQGITYIYKSSADPNTSQVSGAQQYLKEDIARIYNNKEVEGKDVAIFSTDSAVQSTLVEIANTRGLIYVCPSFPTAYNGAAEIYDVEYSADTVKYIENVKKAVAEDVSGTARLSIYKAPLATILLRGAVFTAFDVLNGSVKADNITEAATKRVKANDTFSVSAYGDKLDNAVKVYSNGFEVLR